MDHQKAPSFDSTWLKPQYWGLWLGYALVWLLLKLPLSWLYRLGAAMGELGLYLAPHRRRVCATNLRLCFPNYSPLQQKELLRACFRSVGLSLIETALAWLGSEQKIRPLVLHIEGLEHLKTAEEQSGLLCLGFHFTTLEIIGRLLSRTHSFALLYRAHKNPLFNYFMVKSRAHYVYASLERHELRPLIRLLRQGVPAWYAPDQDYGRKLSVFAPFFNIPTATITTTAKMAKSLNLTVVPVTYYRGKEHHYYLKIHPAFKHYPADDEIENAARINEVLESAIREHPEQYLWQHRRFKTRPNKISKIYVKQKK